MTINEGAPTPVVGGAGAAAGDTARSRPPRPDPPARPSEPLTASQHREWLLLLEEHLPGGEVRLCRPDEWAPEPVCHREPPNVGAALDAWFLLEATIAGEVVKVVSECGYTFTSTDGAAYHQRYLRLTDRGTEFLAYADPAAAVDLLRRKVRGG